MNTELWSSLQPVLGPLALLGGLALLVRLGRALARLVLASAEAATATGLAELSVRRGDLTALAERREAEVASRQHRRMAILRVIGWTLLVLLPLLSGQVRLVYAPAALLWLIPRRRRPGPPPSTAPSASDVQRV